jgi:hypothetical protein
MISSARAVSVVGEGAIVAVRTASVGVEEVTVGLGWRPQPDKAKQVIMKRLRNARKVG